MVMRIFGVLWILSGIYFLLKPKALLKTIQKKGVKKFKKLLFGLGIFLSVTLISFGLKQPGVLSKIILIFGIVGIFKSLFILKAKASEKIINWSLKLPPYIFRLGGVLYIIIGFVLIIFSETK